MSARAILFLSSASLLSAFSTSYTTSFSSGAVGCVVTGNKLFSAGNLIRELTSTETTQLAQYKKDLANFQKKIEEAFENAENIEKNNSTLPPPYPVRPTIPLFCSGVDTILYVFPGCTVQNYKVYIGKSFARELNKDERKKLDDFIVKMKKDNKITAERSLDFCTEF